MELLLNPNKPPIHPDVQMTKEEVGSALVVRTIVVEVAEVSIALPRGEVL